MKKHRFQAVCERVHRYKVRGASLNCINFIVPMNIATLKLIQWKPTEVLENKAFLGLNRAAYWILGRIAVILRQPCWVFCTSF